MMHFRLLDQRGGPETMDASFQVMGPRKYILEESPTTGQQQNLMDSFYPWSPKTRVLALALPYTNCDLEQFTSLWGPKVLYVKQG